MVWLAVFLGGGLGSVARYGVGRIAARWADDFPLGTLLANLLATLILGIVIVAISRQTLKPDAFVTKALTIGFCGGFSTFSTFSLETARLFKSGHSTLAIINIAISVIACVLIAWLLLRKA